MPYGAFKKNPNGGVDVYMKDGSLAFHSNSNSVAQAHRTAAIRELAKHGKLHISRKKK